ncbi:putative encoded by [Lyophyllum shimeji]|uniref:Encoded by n=1 Tax=Lyophyllum shimeji TaxID=47721 RepID=A0A9P3PMI8_LYOSH|nr:putative encoded by [Lyophyllum shimeji]GLB39082.1 putative encoded by [Lyophyllum shimeji]GLB44502.1 putative encoded by [Lyophyllum shimeji]
MIRKRATYTLHDTPKKNRLVGAVHAGLPVAQAAAQNGIHPRSAFRIMKKQRTTGTVSRQPRSGRPPILSERDKRYLARTAVKERRLPFTELGNATNLNVSTSTIRNALAAEGFHRRVAKKVPYLTKAHKKSRMYWARKYRSWLLREWGKVIFSDECYIYLGDNCGRIYVTRRPGEELHEDCVVPSFKQSSKRVMVWGCIISGHKGPLVVLEYPGGKGNGMNSARYQDQVLDGVLVDFHTRMKALKGSVLFQQDNAPSHASKSTKQWFAAHDLPLLYHPASSPDLNPIEHVWHELKTRLRALPRPPNTVEELKAAVLRAWDELPIEDVDKHIRRMPDRVQAILKARGGHTKY